MQRHLIAAIAAGMCLLPTLAAAESRTLEAGTFHGIDVSSGIRAVISGGQPLSVVADSPNAADLTDLRHEVRDGILHLWYPWSINEIWSTRDITVTIGTEVLDALTASSGAAIDAKALIGEEIVLNASSGANIRTNAIEGMSYDIQSNSGARIETSGLCTSAVIKVWAGASVAARELDCANLTLESSSGASLEATARETVNAAVSSGASATVYGQPKVERLETSSGGSVAFPG